MTSTQHSRRRASSRLLGLCLGTAAVVAIPSAALGADAGAATIRAAIGPNGAVRSVQQVNASGGTSSFSGQVPVKMTISRTTSGAQQTYTYHVENTFSKTQTVRYFDTAGHDRKTAVTLQLPLVAQLGVDVPKSMTNITAPNATITQDADGTRHVLWNMVLFTPLGSSAQDVTLTAGRVGTPVAELRATTVNPSTTPGLSSATAIATSNYQQDDFWAGYASGGNDGLTQLSAGATALYQGLAGGLSGTQRAADGSTQLLVGAKKVHAGLADTKDGLTGGLRLINHGLSKLADPVKGLPPAVDGIRQLQAGVAASLAGVGSVGTPKTIINGVHQISGGLALVIQGIQAQLVPGLQCLPVVEGGVLNGASHAAIAANPCYAAIDVSAFMVGPAGNQFLPGVLGIDPTIAASPAASTIFGVLLVTQGFSTAAVARINNPDPTKGLVAALGALKTGADQVQFGLSHKTGTLGKKDPGGLKQGLRQINGGLLRLLDPKKGLPPAIAGIDLLNAGSAKALAGSELLLAGTGFGPKELTGGLQQLSDGLVAGAQSFPAAVSGANQVAQGIVAVQSGATEPLETQLTQSSQNAHQQIAVLGAANSLSTQAPGGEGATYVLTQNEKGFALAASSSSSDTARNTALIALGGVLALAIGIGVGVAIGRQRVSA